MLLSLAALLTPMQFLANLKSIGSCTDESFTAAVNRPSLSVDVTVSGDLLTVDAMLLSIDEGTSSASDAYHAYVAVDGQLVLLNLPPHGKVSLSFPGLARGEHFVRYGVFAGTFVFQEQHKCARI